MYFNPRPREEGDNLKVIATRSSNISIHALVKRATENKGLLKKVFAISIHALVKRATGESADGCTKFIISIHALVKRATLSPASL